MQLESFVAAQLDLISDASTVHCCHCYISGGRLRIKSVSSQLPINRSACQLSREGVSGKSVKSKESVKSVIFCLFWGLTLSGLVQAWGGENVTFFLDCLRMTQWAVRRWPQG